MFHKNIYALRHFFANILDLVTPNYTEMCFTRDRCLTPKFKFESQRIADERLEGLLLIILFCNFWFCLKGRFVYYIRCTQCA